MTRSLATTLALTLVALSVVTLLLASGLQLFSNVRTQQAAMASSQQLIAQGAAGTVSGFIQERFSALETAVRLGAATSSSSEAWTRALQTLLGLQPSFKHLAMLDADNTVLAQTSRISLQASKRFVAGLSGEMLDEIRREERYISPVFIDSHTSEPHVIIAAPLVDALGDRHGSLVADVNLKFMWDLVDQLKVGETGYAYVVDRQGTLLAFGDTTRVLRGENVAQIWAVRLFSASPAGGDGGGISSYTGITGEGVVGGYVPLGTPDWAVVTEMPWDEAYSGIIRDIGLSLGVMLAMAVLAGVVGVYLARRLTGPLVQLMNTATRIAAGDREVRVAVGGPREVANLAGAFNSMAAQLRSTLEGLEQSVAERTAALAEMEARSEEQARLIEQNSQQRQVIRELSVPILPVTGSTLVMPLVGNLDAGRLADIRERALHAIGGSQARRLLLDVTGVPIVDSQVAQGLLGIAQAARLLGAEVVLIGIRPEVAQTIVGLGLDLAAFGTAADLRTAITSADRRR
jgi:anti-anti-sigma regulatory factor/HAMP domain-containing protein